MTTLSTPTDLQPRAGAARVGSVQFVAAALIVTQAIVRGWTCLRGYFYLDDFSFTGRAMEYPLWSAEYLSAPYNSHVMPGSYVWVWLTTHLFPLSWPPVALAMIGLQAALSYLVYRLLADVFGRRRGILVPLAVVTLSPISLPASLWWAAALNQLPQQIAMVAVLLLHVRYLRRGARRDAIGAAVALAAGLLFSEKTLFAVPLVLALTLIFFAGGSALQRITSTLRSQWRVWALYAVVSVPYLFYYVTRVPTPLRPPAAGHDSLELGLQSVFRATIPGLLGGPWHWADIGYAGGLADPDAFMVVVSALLVGLVVVATVAANRGAGAAWAVLAGYAVLNLVLLARSRATLIGPIVGTEYRYQTDLALVAALALAFATMPVVGSFRLAQPSTLAPRPEARAWFDGHVVVPMREVGLIGSGGSGALPLVVVGLVLASSLWSTVAYDPLWVRNPARPYVTTLRAETDAMPEGTVLADAPVPDAVAWALLGPYNRLAHVTAPFLPTKRMLTTGTVAGAIALPDDGGRLNVASVVGVPAMPGPLAGCGWLLGPAPRVVPLQRTAPDEAAVIRLGYIANQSTTLSVTAGTTTVKVPIEGGIHTAFLAVNGPIGSITVVGSGDTTRVCTDDITVGAPVRLPGTTP